MRKLSLPTACAVLLLSGAARSETESALSAYFTGWAEVKGELPAPPEQPHDEHNPVVHMVLARRAFVLYSSRYSGGDLERYIGDYRGDKPPAGHDTVVAGAYEEDKAYLNAFNEAVPVMRHFWDCRRSDTHGLSGHDSGVNRARKYWTGGFGLDGRYDEDWSPSKGQHRGTKGEGAVSLYRRGEKGKAFWYLGHAAHLLQDLTIPAHVLLWPHPFDGDAYESYARDHNERWPSVPSRPIEPFADLRALYAATCEATNRFDAGTGEGSLRGKDGESDRGRRRDGGFSEAEVNEEGDVLMPLAIRRVAALFVLFYKDVDRTAPRVTLEIRAAPGGAALAASASDLQSGVDVEGYRYEWRRARAKEWSPLEGASSARAFFTAPESGEYEFRANAVDAAGNAAWSRPRAVRVASASLVARR
jgi:hypothetical protein